MHVISKVFLVYNSDTLIGRVLHYKSAWTVVIYHRRRKREQEIHTGLAMMHCAGPEETTAGE